MSAASTDSASGAQDGREGFVDSPLLVWADPAHQIAEPSGLDRADLLDENTSRLAPVSPSSSISGRKDAGLALSDVGATRTTERGSNSSACTITP